MDKKVEGLTASEKQAERRKFIKKAGKAALTAPAVALLLSAESKPAQAISVSGITYRGGLAPDLKTVA